MTPARSANKVIAVSGVISLLLLTSIAQRQQCVLRCGVVEEDDDENGASTKLASSIWYEMRNSGHLRDEIDVIFTRVRPRHDVTVDNVIESYMEIGTVNVSAIIGTYSHPVAMTAEKFSVPYLVTSTMDSEQQRRQLNVISILPLNVDLVAVTLDFISVVHWTSVAVVFQPDRGAPLIQLLVLHSDIRVRAFSVTDDISRGKLRELLLHVRSTAMTHLVLMTSHRLAKLVLDQALQLGLLGCRYVWLLIMLADDAAFSWLESYADVGATMIVYRVPVIESPVRLRRVTAGRHISLHRAACHDAILALYHCARARWLATSGDSCQCMTGRDDFLSTLSHINKEGVTGKIRFDAQGHRRGYIIQLVVLHSNQHYQIGVWNSSVNEHDDVNGLSLNVTEFNSLTAVNGEFPLGRDVLRVVAAVDVPFFVIKNVSNALTGNDRFQGFNVDVIRALSAMLNFRYELYVVGDDHSARQDSSVSDKIVRELVDGNAAFSIAPLAMTSQLATSVDFTFPFYRSRVVVATMRRHRSSGWSLVGLGRPLTTTVWVATAVVVVVVGLLISVAHCCRHILDDDQLTSVNDATSSVAVTSTARRRRLKNTLKPRHRITSLNTGSGTLRQHDDGPKSSFVVRLLSVVLRCFVGSLAVIYAAKMSAIFTADLLYSDGPVSVADDDDVISTVSDSDVSRLLSTADTPRQRQLWNVASRRPVTDHDHSNLLDDVDVGFSRLMSGDIDAFIWHEAGLQHRAVAQWGCDWRSTAVMTLEDVGVLTFGIALSRAVGERQTTTRQLLNSALLQLDRENFFQALHSKWSGQNCKDEDISLIRRSSSTERAGLTFIDVSGLFIAVIATSLLCVVVSLLQFIIVRRRQLRTSNDQNQTTEKMCEKMPESDNVDGDRPSAAAVDRCTSDQHPTHYGTAACRHSAAERHTQIF